ncbi:MAG: DUF2970 domain-containing protein [Betaproteobacteria bacterium]|nr:DUF2970 domain-containing protein [Betaproteobacteria bacterium]
MTEDAANDAPTKKATLGQVAATMFWALFMIGKKGTWERDGATLTKTQVVVGGIVMCVIVVAILVAPASLAES